MKFLSLFSGIEAASVAWKPLGWECVGFSEIDPFPCAVLSHHYPDVPNLGDITQISERDIKDLGKIDLIVFGFPCQNLSVAGNRKGLKGKSSGLFYEAIRIIEYARKHCGLRFALLENVPGSFSSNKGDDFREVVRELSANRDINTPKNGWGSTGVALGENGLVEWRLLDAQYFGLAQRRKRVFAIVDFGNWQDRPPILLEPKGVCGDTPPSREAGEKVAAIATQRLASGGEVTGTLQANCGQKQWLGNQEAFTGQFHVVHGTQDPITSETTANCLGRNQGQENVIAIAGNIIGRTEGNGGNGNGFDEEVCYTLTSADRHAVAANSIIRRLTPTECERLQGFPDTYTKIPYRKKDIDQCPDSPRYKALGNSMAVPVMAWIGKQIQKAVVYASHH